MLRLAMACARSSGQEGFGPHSMSRIALTLLGIASFAALVQPPDPVQARPIARACPPEMATVRDFCIDRFEIATVDHASGEPLSPFYPPQPRLVESITRTWTVERGLVGGPLERQMPLPALPTIQLTRQNYVPRAVSKPGIVPQAYLSQPLARLACQNAGKRLCSEQEWVSACRGQLNRKFPYGDRFDASRCNVYRPLHPASLLHGASWYGHRDPRLNLVEETAGAPLLRLTGSTPGCVSTWGEDRIYDLVGNLDEWIDHEKGAFLGGFYARSTREGCESRIGSHAPAYYDYSTGSRCCKDADPLP